MGGIACQIPTNALLAGATPPVQPENASDPTYNSACTAFDAKLRQVFAQTDVVHGIEDLNLGPQVCALLALPSWTSTQRQQLWTWLQSLWPPDGWS